MNKSQLIDLISLKSKVNRRESEKVLDAFLLTIAETLRLGGEVILPKFGKFSVTNRSARIGRNPKTGEAMEIKASKSPSFKSNKSLKEAIK
ncbi:MAG: DNA-binding protein HU [Mycoplasmataceae bacterium]|nr:MAG: DNA-binding protein HU [Mycoplasmataceae bacterium]